ncbi:MAG TPA: choice-of-anchor J domain-containing protein, partial [Bacteroidales bacterium]|nr:choice-of-anchor J domain-containing protein [Bacteroidales bacterium]
DPGNVVVSIVDNVLTLAHDAFLYNTEYTVLVPAGAVTDGTNNLVDNVEWSFTTMLDPTACNNPSNLVISDIQEYQAIVSWTENGIGTQWVVIYGSAGFNPTTEGTQVTVDVTTTTLTGLDDNTDYDVYVQAVCGAETSGWAGPAEFTTLLHCDAVATLPFSEDFESGVFPPTCWNVINTHTDANSNWHEAAAQEGFGAEVQYTDAVMMDEWLISPTLDLSAASGDLHISFDFMCSYYWMVDPYDGADLMLKASTDGGATWTELWNEENYGTFENYTYYSVLLPFTAYAGEANVKIAFQFYGNDGAQTIVDNIVIDLGTNIENETINTVSVYPNPSNGLVNINVTENSVISVIDIAGRTVKSFNVKANEEVNFSQSAGLYIIKVESNGKVSTHKLVIQ